MFKKIRIVKNLLVLILLVTSGFAFGQAGALDLSFGPSQGMDDLIETMILQPDGKLIIVGEFTIWDSISRNGIARLNADGSLDTSFDPGTGVDDYIYSAILQSDGKIIIYGKFNLYNGVSRNSIARINTDGSLDTSFDPGVGIEDGRLISYAILQADGKMIIAGNFATYNGVSRNRIARINSDGSLDTFFDPGIGMAGDTAYFGVSYVGAINMTFQSDNKIMISGTFNKYNGVIRNYIVRINPDGSLDSSFDPGTGINDQIWMHFLQSDEKMIVVGNFAKYGGVTRNRLARINSDGSLDLAFDPGAGPNNYFGMTTQSDGKMIIAGKFTSYNGVSRKGIARINSDGSLDTSFDPGAGVDNDVNSIKIQPDGKIILVGEFTTYNGIARNHIARINIDGSLDISFDPGIGSVGNQYGDGSITSMVLQPDGNIIISGYFLSYNGVPRMAIARVLGASSISLCNLQLAITNVQELTCSNPTGSATSKAYFGNPPYKYSWINGTSVNDSLVSFTTKGVYTVTVVDASNCKDTTSLLVSDSKYPNGFDLDANLITSPFRTGFSATVNLNAVNKGCTSASGQLKLVLDPLISFQNAIPTPDVISNDTLIWDFSSLQYLGTPFAPQINFTTSLLAKIGDSVHLKTIITPSVGDADISNNTKNYVFHVINAYDPNDKKVYPAGDCDEGYIKSNQLLTYTIRFQNTGNAEAINISVLDSLSDNLDLTTLRVVASSDTMHTEFPSANVAKFVFNDINLMDSTSNEPASHGYVVFEIKPKAGLTKGTEIKNKVGIYFDFNPAVVTNTVLNTISDDSHFPCPGTVSITQIENNTAALYPNPSTGIFTLLSNHEIPQNIFVYDKTGRVLLSVTPTSNSTSLDLTKYAADIYFIQVNYNGSVEVVKAVLKD